MKRIIICILWLTCGIYSAEAQLNTNVKEFQEYAEQKRVAADISARSKAIPFELPDYQSMVSLNEGGDGIINVPVVVVKGRKLSLPITLTYVANGIKVDQKASEVGLGWTINFGSILRDYGAYEPDYTYLGKETDMSPNSGGSTNLLFDNQAISTLDQNKLLPYSGVQSGRTPDLYQVNIPGDNSNSFWNTNNSSNATIPTFEFTRQEMSKIEFEKKVFSICQEVSRINEIKFEERQVANSNELLARSNASPMSGANLAAAIGLYPFVVSKEFHSFAGGLNSQGGGLDPVTPNEQRDLTQANLPSSNGFVKYEDYSKFKITKPDGTTYVFGRPLRGQKYMFDEEPFWSARHNDPNSPPSNVLGVQGEFWKVDYIAEWLLTEVRSYDYQDLNNNGIADDGDGGDWIRIEYTDAIQYETQTQVPYAFQVPQHREWLNLTQTDKESSLMRERAYVTKIVTPIQSIDLSNSERFDVDLDYFKYPFNRSGIYHTFSAPSGQDEYNYVYITHPTFGTSTSYTASLDWNGNPVTRQFDVYVRYPSELRKYDSFQIKENISGLGNTVQRATLRYATKGSPQELAVSNYLILDNGKQFGSNPYHPKDWGATLDGSYFYHPNNGSTYNGRGKTTLLGIDFLGGVTGSKISYDFEYAYNPSYSDIHLKQIQRMAAMPALRQSPSGPQRWDIPKRITTPSGMVNLAYSMLPITTFTRGPSYSLFVQNNFGYKVLEDEIGNYFDVNSTGQPGLQGRDAWSLTAVTLPYGGKISMTFESDQFDITADRNAWNQSGISDYATPSVANFNNIANIRSYIQGSVNFNTSTACTQKTLNSEYWFSMNAYSGGLRVKTLQFYDPFSNNSMLKSYAYGTGHYTAPPSEYWNSYLKGFGDFMAMERMNHVYDQLYIANVISPNATWQFDDFSYTMSRLATNTRLETNASSGKHYYTYIDEILADNSKTRHYYGLLAPATSSRLAYNPTQYGCVKGPVLDRLTICDLLVSGVDHSLEIGNYKSAKFNSSNQLVQENSSDFVYSEITNNTVTLKDQTTETFPVQFISYSCQSVPTYPSQVFLSSSYGSNSASPYFFDDGISQTGFAAFGYDNSSASNVYNNANTRNVSLLGQARMPYSVIALKCGLLTPTKTTTMTTDFMNLNSPWSGTLSNSSVLSEMSSLYSVGYSHAIIAPHKDRPYLINALSYKSQQVFKMNRTRQTTTTYF